MHVVSCFVAQKICSFVESFNSFLDFSSFLLFLCEFIVNFLLNFFFGFFVVHEFVSSISSSCLLMMFLLDLPRESERRRHEDEKKTSATDLQHIFTWLRVLVAGCGCRINNNNV